MKANRAGPAIDLLAVSWFPLERHCELVSPFKNAKQTDHRLFVCLNLLSAPIVLLQAMTLDDRQPSLIGQKKWPLWPRTVNVKHLRWAGSKGIVRYLLILYVSFGFGNFNSYRIPHRVCYMHIYILIYLIYLVSALWFRYELEAPACQKRHFYIIHPSIHLATFCFKLFWVEAKIWKTRDSFPFPGEINLLGQHWASFVERGSWVWLTTSDQPIASLLPVIKTHQRLTERAE